MNMKNFRMSGMSGMTLVEMMIAMGIGVFLLTGILSVYISNKDTYLYVQMKARQQENTRLGSTIFGAVIRQTGYIPDPDNTATALELLAYQQGKEASFKAEENIWNFTESTESIGGSGDGQVALGRENNRTITVYRKSGSYTEVMPYDYLRVRFRGGPGIIKCNGAEAEVNREHSNLFYLDGLGGLQCFGKRSTDTMWPSVYFAGPLLGDTGGSRAQQFRILGMAAWFGEDLNNDNVADVYNRAGSVTNWTRIFSIEIKLTSQSGMANPETISYLYDLPNIAP